MSETEASREKLIADVKVVIADAEELLRATAGQAGEKISGLRASIQERLTAAKHKLEDLEDVVLENAKAAGRAADDYVHDHPWKAVGIAAGVGLLVGLLIGRR